MSSVDSDFEIRYGFSDSVGIFRFGTDFQIRYGACGNNVF